jgi:tetratricopeptide (TPR) repeat protein
VPTKFIYLLFILFIAWPLAAQNKNVDSALLAVRFSKTVLEKNQNLIHALEQQRNINIDSLWSSIQKAQQIKDWTIDKQLRIDIARINYYVRLGHSNTALNLTEKNIQYLKNIPTDTNLLIQYYQLQARLSIRLNHHNQALENYYLTLKLSEASHNALGQMKSLLGIGWTHMEMNQYATALTWFKKVLTSNPLNYPDNNLSVVYSARWSIEKGIQIALQYEDYTTLINLIAIKSKIVLHENKISDALQLMNEALYWRKILNGPFYIISDLCLLSEIYTQ